MIRTCYLLATTVPRWEMPVLGLASGLGARGAVLATAIIVALFVLIVGGYLFWRRRQARRRRQNLATAIEVHASLAPKSLSDPNQRAALDKMRQKFQAGLQEFQSRGKDIFRLPWYMIIGEPGSGKTEAIRHSGVEFPSGLQNELQGSGGTVNMDWWFTNRGIILDTAGRLVFNEAPPSEAPEWGEFLRLLKQTRYHCPINGLFIVLSIESLIRDSSEEITQKARRLALQLDLIQRTLDVRFPVYMLVTKSDLLAGFREFFARMDDPLLCHQMFGWSNPEPLDTRFRPEQVGEHLSSIASRLQRRRLALLRDSMTRRSGISSGVPASDAKPRRAGDTEALFALPESILRIRPRLHRYLETIFTAGEWSPKPLFLRGIYFTSSMTEGKTLDEAIAFATGLPLDQLPEEETHGTSRAYFLKDLFLEKVFCESGLVTRATNTISLLRRRRLAVLLTSSLAALLFLTLAGFGYGKLKKAVLDEADLWAVGANNLEQGHWSPPIVAPLDDTRSIFLYGGSNVVAASGQPTLIQYHAKLRDLAQQDLQGGWIFKPIAWIIPRGLSARPVAQRLLFEDWVLEPLVQAVRTKLTQAKPLPNDSASLERLRNTLVCLTAFEDAPASGAIPSNSRDAEIWLRSFLSYLMEKDVRPDPELTNVIASTYAEPALSRDQGRWPPPSLSAGSTLASNKALAAGLKTFADTGAQVDKKVLQQLSLVNEWVDKLQEYHRTEQDWFNDAGDPCLSLRQGLLTAKFALDSALAKLSNATNAPSSGWNNPTTAYATLEASASNAAPATILDAIKNRAAPLPQADRPERLIAEIQEWLSPWVARAAGEVHSSYDQRRSLLPALERDQLGMASGKAAWQIRWNLYSEACLLGAINVELTSADIGNPWIHWAAWTNKISQFQAGLTKYSGPFKDSVNTACSRIIRQTGSKAKRQLAEDYTQVVATKLAEFTNHLHDPLELASRRDWFARIEHDLGTAAALGEQARMLGPAQETLVASESSTLTDLDRFIQTQLGFPLRASAQESMDAKSWATAQQLFAQVTTELSNPLWTARPILDQERQRLHLGLQKYQNFMRTLSGQDQKIVEAEISVVPYERLSQKEKGVVKVFRFARVLTGKNTGAEDLTRPSGPLFTRPLDEAVVMSLQAERNGPTLVKAELEPWWLLRSIRDGKAEAVEEGAVWRIRVPVADSTRKVEGNLVLQVRLPSGTNLPKTEEWNN